MASEMKEVVHVLRDPEVKKILVPERMPYRDAANWCELKAQEEEAIALFTRKFDCLPWAGAFATEKVLSSTRYSAVGVQTSEVLVPAKNGVVKIRWGRWNVVNVGGTLHQKQEQTETGMRYVVMIEAERKLEVEAQALLDEIEQEIKKRELYAGTAIVLQPDANGNLILNQPPKVIDVEKVDASSLILNSNLKRCVEAEVFTPIRQAEMLAKAGLPTRRGILGVGRPGTGKTMTARIAALIAIEQEWAVFYLPDARGIESALRLAQASSPALLICEDLDRQLAGERNALTDRILNALDGLDRSSRVVLFATSNDASRLPAALLRPGRFDSFLTFELPDGDAAEQLLRQYLGENCPEHLNGAGHSCSGLLPASIREVATRSILHAVSSGRTKPDPEDVRAAAFAVKEQQKLLEAAERGFIDPPPAVRVIVEDANQKAAIAVGAELLLTSDDVKEKIQQLEDGKVDLERYENEH